jgi:hypothetical protein
MNNSNCIIQNACFMFCYYVLFFQYKECYGEQKISH